MFRSLVEPLSRSVWKKIVKDEFVCSEKLHAATDPEYDHCDEGRDFGTRFALIKKDHLAAKKPVESESEWDRVFAAAERMVRWRRTHTATRNFFVIVFRF